MTDPTDLGLIQAGVLEISDDNGLISGFVLTFDHEQHLDRFLDSILEYFESHGNTQSTFDVTLTTTPPRLSISISGATHTTSLSVNGIDPTIATRMTQALKRRPYYFILGTVQSDLATYFQFTEFRNHCVFKSELTIDGLLTSGNPNGHWPSGNPLETYFSSNT